MLAELKTQLQTHLEQSLKEAFPKQRHLPSLELETPADKLHGEFSSNIALKSSKLFKKPPASVAADFLDVFQKSVGASPLKDKVSKIEVKKPGFINFYLKPEALLEIVDAVLKEGDDYGRSSLGAKEKIQIEFVSANPTGPLSIAHARQAAVGDALANVLKFIGFDVTSEYYVNDEGNQINLLGESIKCRACELLGAPASIPENGYEGEYIRDIAKAYLTDNAIEDVKALQQHDTAKIMRFGVDHLLGMIRKDLDDFRVHFDVWAYQSKIAKRENIEAILDYLGEKGFLYEKDKALWFKSTDFDDDKDRVLEKGDGSYTYLTPDIVYHKDKYERGFDRVINIWGPDHHGYIPRLKAAVEALGRDRHDLEVLIVQLATIYKKGKPVSMSTRRGQYISLREVMEEVGVDAARFFFLMRHIKVHLDFDLELAKKETPENPVYYIQYAHARVHSINKKAEENSLKMTKDHFTRLKEPEEIDLIKNIGSFPDMLVFCYNQLDPYPLVSHLQELAAAFHRFYDRHRVISEDQEQSSERLALVNATRIVLNNGLRLLGLSTPEKM